MASFRRPKIGSYWLTNDNPERKVPGPTDRRLDNGLSTPFQVNELGIEIRYYLTIWNLECMCIAESRAIKSLTEEIERYSMDGPTPKLRQLKFR